ncbi:hypothetical protein CMV_005752 [Castanea mollissima]|uniref:Uncharacterized protein n=1 Tax=Castanea mollissima TaxID=60419 RepID=A0A8J4RS61_9ROSI|nr:hypothetical protein CMV_005752 [Castanea mollissima]
MSFGLFRLSAAPLSSPSLSLSLSSDHHSYNRASLTLLSSHHHSPNQAQKTISQTKNLHRRIIPNPRRRQVKLSPIADPKPLRQQQSPSRQFVSQTGTDC